MFTLPIKKKWFDMILSGEKTEEYREIKPYWTTRILKWIGYEKIEEKDVLELLRKTETKKARTVIIRNGYSKGSRTIKASCTLRTGEGKIEWGAEAGKKYYIFNIKEIEKGE